MPTEVPATLRLYLDGKIEQFWFRRDTPGVIFLMEVESIDAAKEILAKLPLTDAKILTYEYMEIGPLLPLQFLLHLCDTNEDYQLKIGKTATKASA